MSVLHNSILAFKHPRITNRLTVKSCNKNKRTKNYVKCELRFWFVYFFNGRQLLYFYSFGASILKNMKKSGENEKNIV